MNSEDAIRMAQEAGLLQEWMVLNDDQKSKLIAFAAAMYEKGMDDGAADFERIMLPALIAVEREAIKNICKAEIGDDAADLWSVCCEHIIDKIDERNP